MMLCLSGYHVTSGIPQGSVLGPVLFTIFINDLHSSLKSNGKNFADDTKMFNTSANCLYLHENLNLFMELSQTGKLAFKVDKCYVLHYGNHNDHITYKMDDKTIYTSKLITDLDVTFLDDLTFKEDISRIVASANSKLGILRNPFHDLNKCINPLFVIFLNIIVLLGPLISLCTRRKLKGYSGEQLNWLETCHIYLIPSD